MFAKKTVAAMLMGAAVAFAGVSTAAMAQSVENGTTVTEAKKAVQKVQKKAEKAQKKVAGVYAAKGVVKAVNEGSVEIAHGAVKHAKLAKGTTSFSTEAYKGAQLKAGEKVAFKFREAKTGPELVSAKVLSAKKAVQKAEKSEHAHKAVKAAKKVEKAVKAE